MIALDEATLSWLRDELGMPVGLYVFPSEQDCCAFVPNPVHETVSTYKAGGGIFGYGYEVHMRVRPDDGAARMEAGRALGKLCGAISAREFPEQPDGCVWVGHEVTERPALHETHDDGRETYRLVARITYLERS